MSGLPVRLEGTVCGRSVYVEYVSATLTLPVTGTAGHISSAAAWMAECVDITRSRDDWVPLGVVMGSYHDWCDTNGARERTRHYRDLCSELRLRTSRRSVIYGQSDRIINVLGIHGIRLRPNVTAAA